MRRPAVPVFFAALACAALAFSFPACSSSSGAASNDADTDGATGIQPGQAVGAQCDPTLPQACYNGDPCDTVVCDPVQDPPVCVETVNPGPCVQPVEEGGLFTSDASADTGVVSAAACATSNDCPKVDGATPYVCAYSAFDGCNATGICVVPEPPHLVDGAAEIACGCDGQPVSYVTSDQTAAPVSSPGACVTVPVTKDAGSDAAADAGGGLDAATDAPSDGASE
jgi:hypothetical protein